MKEGQTQEPCNGNCGMNYCDEYGCIENKPEGDVSHLLTPPPAPIDCDEMVEYLKRLEGGERVDSTYIKAVIGNFIRSIKNNENDSRKSITDKYPLATEIINKLNEYCLEQDLNRLGLPCMDELAMAEMEELVVKILNK